MSDVELRRAITIATTHFNTRGLEWAFWCCDDWIDAPLRRKSRQVFERLGLRHSVELPGMVAAATVLPVIGVPVPLKYLDGMDSLLSIVQMPAGVPVATVSIGGARNAGLLAVRMLAAHDATLRVLPRIFARIAATQAVVGMLSG